MSADLKLPTPPAAPSPSNVVNTTAISSSSPSSFWDKASKWASENKALVYTIAGVAVVITSAGVVYYLSDSGTPVPAGQADEKRRAKKEKRKEKKKAEEEKKSENKAATSGKRSARYTVYIYMYIFLSFPR